MTNLVIDRNGDLAYVHTDGVLAKWSSTPVGSSNYEMITPNIDFGQPGQMKKVYKIFITYKCPDGAVALHYATNGKGSFTLLTNLVCDDKPGWVTEAYKIPVVDNKLYSIRFKVTNAIYNEKIITSPAGFEINDISVVYRARRPGIEVPSVEAVASSAFSDDSDDNEIN